LNKKVFGKHRSQIKMKVLFFTLAVLSWQLVVVRGTTERWEAFYQKSQEKRNNDLYKAGYETKNEPGDHCDVTAQNCDARVSLKCSPQEGADGICTLITDAVEVMKLCKYDYWMTLIAHTEDAMFSHKLFSQARRSQAPEFQEVQEAVIKIQDDAWEEIEEDLRRKGVNGEDHVPLEMNLKINFVEAEEGEEGQVVRDHRKKERKMTEKKIDQVNALPRKFQGEKRPCSLHKKLVKKSEKNNFKYWNPHCDKGSYSTSVKSCHKKHCWCIDENGYFLKQVDKKTGSC